MLFTDGIASPQPPFIIRKSDFFGEAINGPPHPPRINLRLDLFFLFL